MSVLDCEHVPMIHFHQKTEIRQHFKGKCVHIIFMNLHKNIHMEKKPSLLKVNAYILLRSMLHIYAARFRLSEKVFGFRRCYRLFWGCCETLSVINSSPWIEEKALNHLIDALVIASLHTSFQAVFLLRKGKIGNKGASENDFRRSIAVLMKMKAACVHTATSDLCTRLLLRNKNDLSLTLPKQPKDLDSFSSFVENTNTAGWPSVEWWATGWRIQTLKGAKRIFSQRKWLYLTWNLEGCDSGSNSVCVDPQWSNPCFQND